MTANAPSTGHLMKLYRNSGTVASPTWTEVSELGDVAIADFSRGVAELKRRGNNYTKNLATLIQTIAIEFRLHHGLGATNFTYLRQAMFAGTVFEIAIMDDAITTPGAQGLRCPVLMEQFPWEQPLEDVSGHDVRLVLAYMVESTTEIDPSWYTVS